MRVYLGSDHRGFFLKKTLFNFLLKENYEVEDIGSFSLIPDDDYVDYAFEVASHVFSDLQLGIEARGIVICGSGMGVSFVASKVKGIRAGVGFSTKQVRNARHDDDLNVLALASDFLDAYEAEKISLVFLKTPFAKEERFLRRLKKLKIIERENG